MIVCLFIVGISVVTALILMLSLEENDLIATLVTFSHLGSLLVHTQGCAVDVCLLS